jgi:hypothetical protein
MPIINFFDDMDELFAHLENTRNSTKKLYNTIPSVVKEKILNAEYFIIPATWNLTLPDVNPLLFRKMNKEELAIEDEGVIDYSDIDDPLLYGFCSSHIEHFSEYGSHYKIDLKPITQQEYLTLLQVLCVPNLSAILKRQGQKNPCSLNTDTESWEEIIKIDPTIKPNKSKKEIDDMFNLVEYCLKRSIV